MTAPNVSMRHFQAYPEMHATAFGREMVMEVLPRENIREVEMVEVGMQRHHMHEEESVAGGMLWETIASVGMAMGE